VSICLDCRHATPDTFESLGPEHRSVTCSKLRGALEIEIACTWYCYGGSVGEIECPATFGCNFWQEREPPGPEE
jgi:hypothetical protein